MKKTLFAVLISSLLSCTKNVSEKAAPQNELASQKAAAAAIADPGTNLWVYANDKVAINPEIFGVNNDWAQITNAAFPAFATKITGLNYQLLRYPGGWESEYYDWNNNTTPGWNGTPATPGATYTTMKNNFSKYTIVIPTAKAMNEVLWSTAWWNQVNALKLVGEDAINKVGAANVRVVEIGNEWWLQWGGGVSRSDKLIKYAKVAMNIAEYLQTKFPTRTFKLLVNGDYAVPSEFTTLKNQFTKAYNAIDGVGLHTYTGYNDVPHGIATLQANITACANNFNPAKNYVYCSEWAPSKAYNNNKVYMEAANIIPDIIQAYGRAGVKAGAYWPPINSSITGLGLMNTSFGTVYPCGQIMSDMASSYKGHAVNTTANGSLKANAALQNSTTLVIYVSGKDLAATTASIQINGFTVNSVQSAVKFRPANYSQTGAASPYTTENVAVTLDKPNNKVLFEVNAAGKYEIFKVILKN